MSLVNIIINIQINIINEQYYSKYILTNYIVLIPLQ